MTIGSHKYICSEGCCICGIRHSSSQFRPWFDNYDESTLCKVFSLPTLDGRRGKMCNPCVLFINRTLKNMDNGSLNHDPRKRLDSKLKGTRVIEDLWSPDSLPKTTTKNKDKNKRKFMGFLPWQFFMENGSKLPCSLICEWTDQFIVVEESQGNELPHHRRPVRCNLKKKLQGSTEEPFSSARGCRETTDSKPAVNNSKRSRRNKALVEANDKGPPLQEDTDTSDEMLEEECLLDEIPSPSEEEDELGRDKERMVETPEASKEMVEEESILAKMFSTSQEENNQGGNNKRKKRKKNVKKRKLEAPEEEQGAAAKRQKGMLNEEGKLRNVALKIQPALNGMMKKSIDISSCEIFPLCCCNIYADWNATLALGLQWNQTEICPSAGRNIKRKLELLSDGILKREHRLSQGSAFPSKRRIMQKPVHIPRPCTSRDGVSVADSSIPKLAEGDEESEVDSVLSLTLPQSQNTNSSLDGFSDSGASSPTESRQPMRSDQELEVGSNASSGDYDLNDSRIDYTSSPLMEKPCSKFFP